jgi:hypothetical protein
MVARQPALREVAGGLKLNSAMPGVSTLYENTFDSPVASLSGSP